jgi:protocatechuate 3,4-dioxygenase beta subunit
VRVLDAEGNPVAGATITFTLGSASPSRCGTTAASGFAISPAFTANTAAGSFTATASISSGGGSESAGKAVESSVASVSFSLVNLAGKPARIAPSVGSTQSTPAGAAFPIPLAVTVTDAEENPVPDALVTFSAPATG